MILPHCGSAHQPLSVLNTSATPDDTRVDRQDVSRLFWIHRARPGGVLLRCWMIDLNTSEELLVLNPNPS